MKLDSFVRILAGTFVVASVILAYTVNQWWLLLTLFVGLNLFQSGFTGFCPPIFVLRKLGWVDRDNVIHWGGMPKAISSS